MVPALRSEALASIGGVGTLSANAGGHLQSKKVGAGLGQI
jgi:hypothetical protein